MSQSTLNRRGTRRYQGFFTVFAVAALTASGFAGAGLPSAEAAWDASVGRGLDLKGVNSSGTLRLGPHINKTPTIGSTGVESLPQWCLNAKLADPGANQLTSIATLTDSRQWGPDELDLTTPQMAWLLNKYQSNKDDTNLAALAYLSHANFEQDYADGTNPQNVVNEIVAGVRTQLPEVEALAEQYVREARNSAAVGYEGGSVVGDMQRTGVLNNIGIQNGNGGWLAGSPVTVTINGPAVFDATGTNTWTGLTQSQPITLTWRATGNGEVHSEATYPNIVRKTLTKYGSDGSVQNMLSYGNRPGGVDPATRTEPGANWRVIFDFQPIATSNVGDYKIVDGNTIGDTIEVKSDPTYGDGDWVKIDGNFVPVVYKGTAYYVGETPVAAPSVVPADAKVVGSTMITADKGPGSYSATIDVPEGLNKEFITWVWQVEKAAQGDNAQYIHADWSDQYGLADETSSVPSDLTIDTTINSHITKSGVYLSDDIFIDGFDDDHGDFAGSAGFDADAKTIDQTLYFFEESETISDENIGEADKIATVTVPAKNGFYSHVGSTKFKVAEGKEGTYVFRTCFAGDARTKAFCTSVTDVSEQYKMVPEIEIKTTATDASDGDKVMPVTGMAKLNDHVCHTNLKPGKVYELEATLMDKATGESFKDASGNPIVVKQSYTPVKADDCTDVVFEYDAALTAGKSTVVFERLYRDKVLIVAHTDINDEGQTVTTPGSPKIGTTATDGKDGDKIVASDAKVSIVDKVCYENLTVGKEYKTVATLMDRATNAPVVGADGKPVTAEATFTPANAKDCTNVKINFDASKLGGHKVTVFEKVFDDQNTVVASHEDINDEGQTVTIKGGKLAFTGAQMTGLLVVSVLLLAGGTAFVVVRRRQDRAEA